MKSVVIILTQKYIPQQEHRLYQCCPKIITREKKGNRIVIKMETQPSSISINRPTFIPMTRLYRGPYNGGILKAIVVGGGSNEPGALSPLRAAFNIGHTTNPTNPLPNSRNVSASPLPNSCSDVGISFDYITDALPELFTSATL